MLTYFDQLFEQFEKLRKIDTKNQNLDVKSLFEWVFIAGMITKCFKWDIAKVSDNQCGSIILQFRQHSAKEATTKSEFLYTF